MDVIALRAFEDNFLYALVDRAGYAATIVDPGEADPPLRFLEREGLELRAVLITHHHRDHVGGLAALVASTPGVKVVAPVAERERIRGANVWVAEGDRVPIPGAEARVIEAPGHTRGHVAYFVPVGDEGGDLFSGDVVFGGTIGNLFEGTADDMFGALTKIRALPPRTRLWCGHEYTLRYVAEALRFDPGNVRLAERLRRVEADVRAGRPTVPLTLEEERATNPFFRWDDADLAKRLGTRPGIETFRRLCEVL